jgi:RNA polymerase sigma-70 factor (ECF subfamily)
VPVDFDALLARGRKAWPGVALDAGEFRAFVSARLEAASTVDEIRAEDLYLACACSSGAASALAAFAAAYDHHVAAILGRLGLSTTIRTEAQVRLATHLFLAEGGAAPRIASYSGRGELLAFVRVAAIRLALGLAKKESRPGDEPIDEELPDDVYDPELLYLKELYRGEFNEAFSAAVAGLAPRERTLLRYHLVDGLSIDKLAAVYGVHRSTAARQLASVRAELAASTQRLLMEKLRIDKGEVASIIRLVMSQLDVSVRRLLGESA